MNTKYLVIIILLVLTLSFFFIKIKIEEKLEEKVINEILTLEFSPSQKNKKLNLNELNNEELLNIYIEEDLIPLSEKNFFYDYISNIKKIDSNNLNFSQKNFNNQNNTNIKNKNLINNKTLSKVNFPIDINKATYEELIQIPGIGPTLAKRIIEWREQNGNFNSIEDLIKVKGIGEKIFEKIKSYFIINNK
ncbi:MAG: helix-hairpin-helix domain-containing protein [Spirochaetes bacterium]|nr:helix-hairpin-helix domain-containing protein [Spirochaetota bacterium]